MYPHQLMVYDTSLYVVGNFTTAGGVTVNGIARWDGTQWNAMGVGFDQDVYGIGVFDGEIYATGGFTHSGSTPLNCIAKWNGTSWVSPGFSVFDTISAAAGGYAYVHTVAQIGSRCIFEGGFNRVVVGADTFVANNIIAFDGTNVDTLAGGIRTANLEGLQPYDSSILVGGALFPGFVADTTNMSKYHFSNLGITVVKGNELNIYPNPFTDAITIEGLKKGNEVRVFNIMGQQVKYMVAGNSKETLMLRELEPGAYILQISGNDSVQYKEIYKQ
jgi:hypothetical protein